ncbi:MAG TPA: dephospho-CoA kinase [Candidatus Sulfotelmatobacter sp.]|jgi:dephospho-CoA kinase|nr:dephospho-CoA kinase [Candidatus Sulfotelmatobacter sp.]
MLRVGLTGGIATGKTTVASLLRDCDVPVLNADTIGHELLEPGQEAYDEIVAVFDEDILDADGKVNRAKLGGVIFADAQKRARLNQILHPRILEIVQKWFAALDEPDGPEFAVVEAALIFEARYNQRLDKIIVCWCLPEQQMERLTLRGLSVEEAQQRIAAQMPLSDKRKLADESIDCSGSIEETQRQVNQVAEKLKLSGSGRNIP